MFKIPCAEICPPHATGNYSEPCAGFATRWCRGDGHWEPKSNYNQCAPYDFRHENYSPEFFRAGLHSEHDVPLPNDNLTRLIPPLLFYLSLISMLSCFISFFLFRLRNLRCTRISIHQNLLVAWFFKYMFVIIRTKEWLDQPELTDNSTTVQMPEQPSSTLSFMFKPSWQVSCVIFHEFFYLAGHSWFFIEALYLHHQISYGVFGSSSLKLKHFVAIGWTIPVVFIIPWSILVHYRYVALDEERFNKFVNSEISSTQYALDLEADHNWRNVNDLNEHWLQSGPIVAMLLVTIILLGLCCK